ncbi:MAG TPA: hypothetical protein VMH02_12965 [Verrucomicrobiae bacterium]|nr:hypothetical protein [Verrucomicrobiae bacterium]
MKRWEVRRYLQTVQPPVHFIDFASVLLETLTKNNVISDQDVIHMIEDVANMAT